MLPFHTHTHTHLQKHNHTQRAHTHYKIIRTCVNVSHQHLPAHRFIKLNNVHTHKHMVCVWVDCSCGVCYLSFPADWPTCTPAHTDERQRGVISSPHTLGPELFYPTFRCFEMLQTIKNDLILHKKNHTEMKYEVYSK